MAAWPRLDVSPCTLAWIEDARPAYHHAVPADDPDPQLALVRDLAARWLPRRGRRARWRLGACDVLRVMRATTDNAELLAAMELRFIVEELLVRGRKQDGTRVTHADLIAAGLWIEPEG